MCEMVVSLVNGVFDAGDVIEVCPDGWRFSEAERTNPDWRIVKVPGVSVEDALAFIGPEINDDPADPSRPLQRRAFGLDLAADPKNLEQLLAAKVRKPRIVDPGVL